MNKKMIRGILLLSMFIPFGMLKTNAASPEFRQTIATSTKQEYAITEDGCLYSWQKSNPTFGEETTPPDIIMDDVIGIYAAYDHAFAIKADHSLWEVEKYVLGNEGKLIKDSLPIQLAEDVQEAALGFEECIYLKLDKTVWTWNYDKNTAPVKVDIENVKQISAAFSSFYAVTEDGMLWGWGDNELGQLGSETDQKRITSPMKITDNVERVYGAYAGAYAIKKDGSLWNWGTVSLGFYQSNLITPVKIMEDAVKVTGYETLAVIKNDNSLWLCGYNQKNIHKDGFNAIEALDEPVKVLDDVADVSILGKDLSVLKKDGTLWSCSDNLLTLWGIGTNELKLNFEKMLDHVAIPGNEGILASSWARDDIAKAIEQGLVPESLQSSYKQNIKRGDFALLIANLLTKATNKELDTLVQERQTGQITLNDTDDQTLLNIAKLGVIQGVGNNRFNPEGFLTREQAATILMRVSKFLGETQKGDAPHYADHNSISKWAVDGVYYCCANGIMNGTGGNQFSPAKDYSREMSIITIVRLYEACPNAAVCSSGNEA